MRPRRRNVLSWAALLVTAVLLLALLYVQRDELGVLRGIQPLFIAALLALQLLYQVLQAARLKVVLEKCAERRVAYAPWFRLFVLGRFLTTFVPQSGNVYRAVELKREFDVTITRYLAAVFANAWLVTALTMFLAAVLVTVVEPEAALAGLPAGVGLLAVAVLVAVGPVIANALLDRVDVRQPRAIWLHGRFSELLRVSVESFSDMRYLASVFLWTVVTLLQASLTFWVCFQSLAVPASFFDVVLFYLLLQVTSQVVLTPGNLGVQELAFGMVAAGAGMGAVHGVLVSALLRATGSVALIALALPLGGIRVLKALSWNNDREVPDP